MRLSEFKSKATRVEFPMGYKHVYNSVTANLFEMTTNISNLGIKCVMFFIDNNKVDREEFLSLIDDEDQFLISIDENNGESWTEDGIQYSGCCSARVYEDTDLCSDCKEHI